jgi:DNA replication factor GINS
MPLDDLRIVILNERESGRLSEVPPTLFEHIRGHLATLQEQVYGCSDPLSDEAQALIEEVKAVREISRDIFRIRSRKILSLALVQVEADATNRDELKKMLPEEREMFDGIVRELGRGKAALSGTVPRLAPLAAAPVPGEATPAGALPGAALPPEEAMVLVRVLTDMEPFMGVDGRIYHLKAEDLVTLPGKNAAVLVDRNIALDVMTAPGGRPEGSS